MKIYLDQIPQAGLELCESYQPSDLDLSRPDIKLAEPIKLSAQVSKEINIISVRLKIEAMMYLDCSRCLEEFMQPLSKEITLNLSLEGGKQEIDLTDNLREEIILSYPLKPLCSLDCLGLCPTCGQNLNKAKCNCQP